MSTRPPACSSDCRVDLTCFRSCEASGRPRFRVRSESVDTSAVRTTHDRAVSDVRDLTKASIERGIDFLLDEQRFDPNRSVLNGCSAPRGGDNRLTRPRRYRRCHRLGIAYASTARSERRTM